MRQVIYVSLVLLTILCACNIHEQVDDEYFSSIDRVKGKNKPAAPVAPTVACCERSISVTITASTDEDGDGLSYLLYASREDLSAFDVTSYYDEFYIVGVVSDIAEPIEFYTSDTGNIFFWCTAFDGGRESDHSEVVSVSVPGLACP